MDAGFTLTMVAVALWALPVPAQEEPANPYALYYAEVVQVIDGDTLDVRVDLWPGVQAVYAVRVRGIDAPELRRSACEAERLWAEEAKAQVTTLYDPGSRVRLSTTPGRAAFARPFPPSRHRSVLDAPAD